MPELSAAQLERFEEDGFVVAAGLLSPKDELQPAIDEYAELTNTLCSKLYADGKLRSAYCELPFQERISQLLVEGGMELWQYYDFSLQQGQVTEDSPIHLGRAVFELMRNPCLLDAVESIIGPEIYSNPVGHVRLRPPEGWAQHVSKWTTQQTPWHQDLGVVTAEADESDILSVWFPCWDTDAENGCLWMVPGSHRQKLVMHCSSSSKIKGTHIPDQLIPLGDAIPIPMHAGDVLFFTRFTMHCSGLNRSDHLRMSFDLRYNRTGQPTGRSAFPGFVARSRHDPASELTNHGEWVRLWRDARSRLAQQAKPRFHRWTAEGPLCA